MSRRVKSVLRTSKSRSWLIGVCVLALCLASCAAPLSLRAPQDTATQPLSGFPFYAATVVVPSIDVHAEPADGSPVLARLARYNENGAPQTFLLEHTQVGPDRDQWYDVMLPIRPNGSSGWVRASDVAVTGLRDMLVVHVLSFRLELYEDGRLSRSFPIGVGTQDTPTPSGAYYVKELIRPPDPDTIYGHYVLGLSGFSDVLLHWTGGGVIGIHGTNNLDSIGRRVSHGCIRMSNANIEYLARTLPLGTPVRIEAS